MTQLTFSGEDPVVIKTKTDGLFSPLKLRSCTVKLVSDQYYFDMYSAGSKDVLVQVERLNNNDTVQDVVFRGYVTPCIYNQDFTNLDEIDIECTDALSVLQYIDYEPIGGVESQFSIVSLYDILKKMMNGHCGYRYMYFSNDMCLSSSDTNEVLKRIKVNETNFYEDDGDYTVNRYGELRYDADTVKCDKVLEQICQLLNVSCCVYNDEVYLINYSALERSNYMFWKYDFSNDNVISETKSDTSTLQLSDFNSGTPSLSLSEVYNKIEVECNTYEIPNDVISPDPLDVNYLVPYLPQGAQYNHTDFIISGINYYYYDIPYKNKRWESFVYGSPGARIWWRYNTTSGKCLLDTSVLTTQNFVGGKTARYYRDDVVNEPIPEDDTHTFDDITYVSKYQDLGCSMLKYFNYTDRELIPSKAEWDKCMVFGLGLPQRTSGKASTDFINYNTFLQNNEIPLCRYTSPVDIVYGDATKDTYFVINGSVFYSYFWIWDTTDIKNVWYTQSWTEYGGENKNWKYPSLQMSIKIGDTYVYPQQSITTDGWLLLEGNTLYTSNTLHKFWVPASKDCDFVSNEWMSIFNTVSYEDNIDASGYKLTIPAGTVLSGPIEISFYCPWINGPQKYHGLYQYYYHPRWVLLKDFKFKYCTQEGTWYNDSDRDELDYTYTNVINDDYVLEGDKISLDISTQRSDKPQGFHAMLNANNTFISTLYSRSLYSRSGVGAQKQEFNIIEQQYDHFSKPRKCLDCTLVDKYKPYSKIHYNMLNADLLVDGMTHYLQDGTVDINLIEY